MVSSEDEDNGFARMFPIQSLAMYNAASCKFRLKNIFIHTHKHIDCLFWQSNYFKILFQILSD